MANEQNLIPFNKQTEEEQREKARKGGIASGVARRKRKAMKENLELLLSLKVQDKKIKAVMKALGIKESEMTNQMAMQVAMLNQSLKGNVQAYKELRDTVEGKPTDNIKVDGNINTANPLESLSTEEIRKAIELMNNGKD